MVVALVHRSWSQHLVSVCGVQARGKVFIMYLVKFLGWGVVWW